MSVFLTVEKTTTKKLNLQYRVTAKLPFKLIQFISPTVQFTPQEFFFFASSLRDFFCFCFVCFFFSHPPLYYFFVFVFFPVILLMVRPYVIDKNKDKSTCKVGLGPINK